MVARSNRVRNICPAAVLAASSLLVGCTQGGALFPPPPVSVEVSPPSASAEAGASVQLSWSVSGTTDESVSWSVNGVAGGNAAVGSISAAGLYRAPQSMDATTTVTVTATSHADPSKSANVPVTLFAAARIGVRATNGAGEFYDRATDAAFVPRGNNYTRLAVLTATWGETFYHSTFNVGLYDGARAEQALKRMQAEGYNSVRVFLDGCCASGTLGDAAAGVSASYLANVADFLGRAHAHAIVVILVLELPKVGGYQDSIGPNCATAYDECNNAIYLTTAGINSYRKFVVDLLGGLLKQKAAMDAVFAYELANEFRYRLDIDPLDQTSGTFAAANGTSYDLADPAARQALMNDGLAYFTDQVRAAILGVAPSALVTVSFWSPNTPDRPPFSAIAASTADCIEFHSSPSAGETLAGDASSWGMTQPSMKPVLMGEFAADLADFATEALAAQALHDWQVGSCAYGFDGWLLWTWDADADERPATWNAIDDTGLVDATLAPAGRPDACH